MGHAGMQFPVSIAPFCLGVSTGVEPWLCVPPCLSSQDPARNLEWGWGKEGKPGQAPAGQGIMPAAQLSLRQPRTLYQGTMRELAKHGQDTVKHSWWPVTLSSGPTWEGDDSLGQQQSPGLLGLQKNVIISRFIDWALINHHDQVMLTRPHPKPITTLPESAHFLPKPKPSICCQQLHLPGPPTALPL